MMKVAFLLPPRLVYFCYIRFMSHATTWKDGKSLTPDEVTFSKATKLWEDRYGKV